MPSLFKVAVDDKPKEFTGENPVIKREIKEEPIEQLSQGDYWHLTNLIQFLVIFLNG